MPLAEHPKRRQSVVLAYSAWVAARGPSCDALLTALRQNLQRLRFNP